MNREDIIAMAREADEYADKNEPQGKPFTNEWAEKWEEVRDTHFAALVAAAEREACANVCDKGVDTEHPTVKGHIMKDFGASSLLAAAIRARSNT
jgi:hypothetical protein